MKMGINGEDNRGTTLIEMLVAMTVSVIVIGAIMMFMSNGIKNFNQVDREVTLQQELQTVSNQIGDMLLDANHVAFDAGTKTLTIRYVGASYPDKRKVITMDAVNHQLYLTSYNSMADESSAVANLLSDYVEDFQVTITNNQTIVLTLKLEWQGKKKELETTIVLRNRWKAYPPVGP